MRRSHGVLPIVLAGVAVTAAAVAAVPTKLSGSVGPGFTIALRDEQGQAVTRIAPGAFAVDVDDQSELHSFRLTGPGVDVATSIEATGKQTFNVSLVDGRYRFLCDAHPTTMNGTFDVGTGPAPPPPPPPPPPASPPPPPAPKASAPVGARLQLTVGPGFAISLKTAAGKAVKVLRPGAYTVVARDRSGVHNARLRGAGVAKATGVGFIGTRTWRIVVRKGTLVVQCDPHRTSMRTTVRVV